MSEPFVVLGSLLCDGIEVAVGVLTSAPVAAFISTGWTSDWA
jgi:hypothetical protein